MRNSMVKNNFICLIQFVQKNYFVNVDIVKYYDLVVYKYFNIITLVKTYNMV